YILNSDTHFLFSSDEVRCWENSHMFTVPNYFAGKCIYFSNPINFVPKKFNTNTVLLFSVRHYFYRIATNSKSPTLKINIIPSILNIYKYSEQFISFFFHTHSNR